LKSEVSVLLPGLRLAYGGLGLPDCAQKSHNGAGANLSQVVNFYDKRFQIGLTSQQKEDLINFPQTL